jgi:ribosomal protein L37AE/L43A
MKEAPMPVYECENCGKKQEVEKQGADVPECCGKPMRGAQKLPVCEVSSTAEHSRFTSSDDACDDGRSGD